MCVQSNLFSIWKKCYSTNYNYTETRKKSVEELFLTSSHRHTYFQWWIGGRTSGCQHYWWILSCKPEKLKISASIIVKNLLIWKVFFNKIKSFPKFYTTYICIPYKYILNYGNNCLFKEFIFACVTMNQFETKVGPTKLSSNDSKQKIPRGNSREMIQTSCCWSL